MENLKVLLKNSSLIKVEQVADVLEVTADLGGPNTYRILNSDSTLLAIAIEKTKPGFWWKVRGIFFRTPEATTLQVFGADQKNILMTFKFPVSGMYQDMSFYSGSGDLIAKFSQQAEGTGTATDVLDPAGQVLFQMKSGLLKNWTFRLLKNEVEFGQVVNHIKSENAVKLR